jgi:hypothetical protein
MGELRNVHIEKNLQPLGFNLNSGTNGGVFVAHVSQNSLAEQAGLLVSRARQMFFPDKG